MAFDCGESGDRAPEGAPEQAEEAFDFAAEEQTADMLSALQAGSEVDTRQLLNPIYKWAKSSARNRDYARSFGWVAWLDRLAREGAPELGIAAQPQVQPAYAYNTLITACQRNSDAAQALRAYGRMRDAGYTPDVFTFTAVLDVVARSGDLALARRVYQQLRESGVRPNVVTMVSAVRGFAACSGADSDETIFSLLRDAREVLGVEGTDVVVYEEALKHVRLPESVPRVLAEMREFGAAFGPLTGPLVARATRELVPDGERRDALADAWIADGLVPAALRDALTERAELEKDRSQLKKTACLGPSASEALRDQLIRADLQLLRERLEQNPEQISRDDFETLLHQCRKRRWSRQVPVVIAYMWQLPLDRLRPNRDSYNTGLHALYALGEADEAQRLRSDMTSYAMGQHASTYKYVVRGSVRCDRLDEARQALDEALEAGLQLDHKTCRLLLLGFGAAEGRLDEGIAMARRLREGPDDDRLLRCLVEGAANARDLEAVRRAALLLRSGAWDVSVWVHGLRACCGAATLSAALARVDTLVQDGLLPQFCLFRSVLQEVYCRVGSSDISQHRRGASDDALAERVLTTREKWFRRVVEAMGGSAERFQAPTAALRSASGAAALLEGGGGQLSLGADLALCCVSGASDSSSEDSSESGEDGEVLGWLCELSAAPPVPAMFAQHVWMHVAAVRGREEKERLESVLATALLRCRDAVSFLLTCIAEFPLLELQTKSQVKAVHALVAAFKLGPGAGLEEEAADLLRRRALDDLVLAPADPLRSPDLRREVCLSLRLAESFPAAVAARFMEDLHTPRRSRVISFLVEAHLRAHVDCAAICDELLADYVSDKNDTSVLTFVMGQAPEALEAQAHLARRLHERGDRERTLHVIRRFKLHRRSPEFQELADALCAELEASSASIVGAGVGAEPEAGYLRLPFALKEGVTVVATAAALAACAEALRRPDVTEIGLDSEWRPHRRLQTPSPCALLQVATHTHVWLLDLLALGASVSEALAEVFADPGVLKLGFGLGEDLERLKWSYPGAACFETVEPVLDLQGAGVSVKKGLKALVREKLGAPLDKRQQMSDWEARPLSEAQQRYAALDAWVLLRVWQVSAAAK